MDLIDKILKATLPFEKKLEEYDEKNYLDYTVIGLILLAISLLIYFIFFK